jgi:hypothetical protein
MDLSRANWRKASYSSSNGGQCVEVADGGTAVAVRDSKDPGGSMLVFPPHEWHAFCVGVKRGDFDVS